MAMTAEQRRIKRLEKQVQDLKTIVKELEEVERKKDCELMYERQWRQDFQRLMKDVVHADKLDDIDREYW